MPSFVGKDYVLVTSEEMIGLVAPVKPGTGTGSRGKNIAGRLPEVQFVVMDIVMHRLAKHDINLVCDHICWVGGTCYLVLTGTSEAKHRLFALQELANVQVRSDTGHEGWIVRIVVPITNNIISIEEVCMDAYNQLERSKPMSMKVEGPTSTAGAGNRRAGAPTAKQAHRNLYIHYLVGSKLETAMQALKEILVEVLASGDLWTWTTWKEPESMSTQGQWVTPCPIDVEATKLPAPGPPSTANWGLTAATIWANGPSSTIRLTSRFAKVATHSTAATTGRTADNSVRATLKRTLSMNDDRPSPAKKVASLSPDDSPTVSSKESPLKATSFLPVSHSFDSEASAPPIIDLAGPLDFTGHAPSAPVGFNLDAAREPSSTFTFARRPAPPAATAFPLAHYPAPPAASGFTFAHRPAPPAGPHATPAPQAGPQAAPAPQAPRASTSLSGMTDMDVLRAKLVKAKAIRDRARQGKVTEAESDRRSILAKIVQGEAERRRKEAQKCHKQRIHSARFLEVQADEELVEGYRDVVVLRRLALELEHEREEERESER